MLSDAIEAADARLSAAPGGDPQRIAAPGFCLGGRVPDRAITVAPLPPPARNLTALAEAAAMLKFLDDHLRG